MVELEDGLAVAERIRRAVARCKLPSAGGELNFTVSLGAGQPLDGEDAAEFLQRVENACIEAWEQGGNCVFFDSGNGPQPAIAQATTA
jgi:GGDEF domain-containing protein